MFGTRKSYKGLKLIVVLSAIFLLFPFFGSFFNGFCYTANRWVFLFMFAASFILTIMWPCLKDLNKRQIRFVIMGSCSYTILVILLWAISGKVEVSSVVMVLFLLVNVIIIILFQKQSDFTFQLSFNKAMKLLFSLLLFNIILNWYNVYDQNKDDGISSYLDTGTCYSSKENSMANSIPDTSPSNPLERFEFDNHDTPSCNSSVLFNTHSTQFYWSLGYDNIPQYLSDMGIAPDYPQKYFDLDQRAYLDTLAGVKYYIQSNDHSVVPYGFNKINTNSKYTVYENSFSLPLGYTYDNYLTHEIYDKLSGTQKQQAIAQGVLLEKTDVPAIKENFPLSKPVFSQTSVPYTITCSKNVIDLGKNRYLSTSTNRSYIDLELKQRNESDLYLEIYGMTYDHYSYYDLLGLENELPKGTTQADLIRTQPLSETEQEVAQLETDPVISLGEKLALYRDKTFFNSDGHTSVLIRIKARKAEKTIRYRSPNDGSYSGQHDYVVNLGHWKKKGSPSIRVYFPAKGIYSFDNLLVTSLPMEEYQNNIKNLSESSLEDVSITEDTVTGSINTSHKKILCLAIPYEKGWEAYVDNKPTSILRANTMFMALPLESGNHKIKLIYHTPGLKEGGLISLAGIVCFIFLAIVRKKRNVLHS